MKLVNDLRGLSISQYEQCLQDVKNSLRKIESVLSLYQFGSISFPGISDIDLLVVLKSEKNFESNERRILDCIKGIPNTDYCFFHRPMIVTESNLRYLPLFHSAENLNFLDGTACSFESPWIFDTRVQLSWNIFFYKLLFRLHEATDEVSLRYVLLLLKNIIRTIESSDEELRTQFSLKLHNQNNQVRHMCSLGGNPDLKMIMDLFSKIQSIVHIQEKKRANLVQYPRRIITPKVTYYTKRGVSYNIKKQGISMGLPSDYFLALKGTISLVEKLEDMTYSEFVSIRERFTGVDILGF